MHAIFNIGIWNIFDAVILYSVNTVCCQQTSNSLYKAFVTGQANSLTKSHLGVGAVLIVNNYMVCEIRSNIDNVHVCGRYQTLMMKIDELHSDQSH